MSITTIDELKERNFNHIKDNIDRLLSGKVEGDDLDLSLLYASYIDDIDLFNHILSLYPDTDIRFADDLVLRVAVVRSNVKIFNSIIDKWISNIRSIDFNNLLVVAESSPYSNKRIINSILDKCKGICHIHKDFLKNIAKVSSLEDLRDKVALCREIDPKEGDKIDFNCLDVCIEANRNDLSETIMSSYDKLPYLENHVILAARLGNIEFLKLVEKRFRISDRILDHACTMAASRGKTEVALYLSNKANDPEYTQSLLLATAAAIKNNEKFLIAMLSDKADIHYNDDFALYTACEHGITENVKVLLQHCANSASFNNRCLKIAAKNNYTDIIEILIANGAEINDNNDEALRMATRYGNHAAMDVLLANGANPKACRDECIIIAIEKEDDKALDILTRCPVQYTNIQVILMYCIKKNNMHAFHKLVQDGKIDREGLERHVTEADNIYKSILETVSEYAQQTG